MKKTTITLDLPVCVFLLQECKRGDRPCPGIQVNDMDEWYRAAEAMSCCELRGATLTKDGTDGKRGGYG